MAEREKDRRKVETKSRREVKGDAHRISIVTEKTNFEVEIRKCHRNEKSSLLPSIMTSNNSVRVSACCPFSGF